MLVSESTSRQFIDEIFMESMSSPGYTGKILIKMCKVCMAFNLSKLQELLYLFPTSELMFTAM